MKKLKTRAKQEQERREAQRYALGNVVLDTQKLLLIYARQSSSKQYVSNIYSAMEQRDGLLERAGELGWTRDEQWVLYVENQLAKKTQVSGSLRIDQRPGLWALTEVIESGKASAVLVVSVDRITRDEDLITPTAFANLCKRHGVLIITDEYIYDFNNPNRDDMGRFMHEAIASKEYIRKQVKGKMLKNRDRKANMGRVANGMTPIGMKLDEARNNLVVSPHISQVKWLYTRFKELDANLNELHREVVHMAQAGIPLFPDPDGQGWEPDYIHLRRMQGGWTIASRVGLRGILTNAAYIGHTVWSGVVVKRDTHPPVIDPDLWYYAFDHLAEVDLDGIEIEREERQVRYNQKSSGDSGALLAGVRDNGKLVIDGVKGAHVYVHMPDRRYQIKNWTGHTVNGTEASIDIDELDQMFEERLRYLLEKSQEYNEQHFDSGQAAPFKAVESVSEPVPLVGSSLPPTELEQTENDLALVQRALRFQESMTDERLEESLKKEARLIRRLAELHQVQARSERIVKQKQEAHEDMDTASSQWAGWMLEKKRSFIRLVTDEITLEEIGSGWMRLTVVWSPLMGLLVALTLGAPIKAVDVAYIWRTSGDVWTTDELYILAELYPTSPRSDILRALPNRSWYSILVKAKRQGITRTIFERTKDEIDKHTSLSDMVILSEFMLEPGKRIQWRREVLTDQGSFIPGSSTNDDTSSCSGNTVSKLTLERLHRLVSDSEG